MTRELAERCLELRLKVTQATQCNRDGRLITVMDHTALIAWCDGGEDWYPLKTLRQA